VTPVKTFHVYTMDGEHATFEDNAEGFIVRWREAMVNNAREWPVAYDDRYVYHYNPMLIVAVAVEMSEDG
jgi:hypothetical protein